ncbi:MAG: phosphomannomutase/phosphoglucomutase, partial [Candidatus Binatia bacterium]
PNSTILYDLRSSRATKEVIEEAGGVAAMSKVGHSNIKAQMRTDGAIFAGELSGHFYFTPSYAESGLGALGFIIKLLKESGKSLSEVVAPIMRYAKTAEINFEVKDTEAVLRRLREIYADAKTLELDGVSILYPQWWANIRASNTEPLLRLNMEADTPELLATKRQEIEALIAG